MLMYTEQQCPSQQKASVYKNKKQNKPWKCTCTHTRVITETLPSKHFHKH